MPFIYNSGTISDITEINVPKTNVVKSIMYYVTQPMNMAKNVQFHTIFGTHKHTALAKHCLLTYNPFSSSPS